MTIGRGIAAAGLAIAGAMLLIYDVTPVGYLPLTISVYICFLEK
jgi:hypothetical protein